MRSIFSVVSVLFVGLIGCRTPGPIAGRSDLAQSPAPDDPAKICPDICAPGTLCEMPDGSCTEVCNACYCTREGGTPVEACPKADVAPRDFRANGLDQVAASDADRAR
jgi:hypothetical protein